MFLWLQRWTYNSGLTHTIRSRRAILTSMWSEQNQKPYASHLGTNDCLRRARYLIFRQGMSTEIRQYVEAYATCTTNEDLKQAEFRSTTPVPERPWPVVANFCPGMERAVWLVWMDTAISLKFTDSAHQHLIQ